MSFLKAFTRAAEHNSKSDKKKSFKITYKKMNGRTVKRKIDPQNIRGNLIVAWDHKRKAIRSFKIDKVKSMEKAAFWKGFEKVALDSSHALIGGAGLIAGGVGAYHVGKKKGKHEGANNAFHFIQRVQEHQQALRAQQAKQASLGENLAHGAELAGLGILAAPSVKHLVTGKDMNEKNKSRMEVAGLGVLAAPSAIHLGKKLLGK